MKNYTFLFLIMSVIFSCEKEITLSTVIDTTASFSVLNEEGFDLLDNTSSNYIDLEESRVFHFVDGEWIPFYEDHLKDKYGLSFPARKQNNADFFNTKVSLFPYGLEMENGQTIKTKIQWNDQLSDIVTTTFFLSQGDNGFVFQTNKIWINGDLVYEEANKQPKPIFTLKK